MGKGLRLLLSGLAEYPFLRLLAPAFWVAWITIFYSGFVIVTSSSSAYDASASLFSVSTFALAATIIVSSFAVDVAWRIISNARTMALIAVVAALCTVLVGFEGVVPDPVYWIAAPLTGVSTACLAMRCAMIYSELEPHRATSLWACARFAYLLFCCTPCAVPQRFDYLDFHSAHAAVLRIFEFYSCGRKHLCRTRRCE